MAIFATGVNKANLTAAINRICSNLHYSFSDARAMHRALSEWTDPDLMAALEITDPSELAGLRELVQHLVDFEENYRGLGTLANRSYHVAKRVDIVSR